MKVTDEVIDMQVQVAGALLVRDDRVLMGLRSPAKLIFPEKWDCIGGKVENRESAAEALVRELREELDITLTRWSPLTTIITTKFKLHLFAGLEWVGGEPTMLGDEHTNLCWFTPNELATLSALASPDYIRFAERAIALR